MQIFEHPELKEYLPPLDEKNFELLKASIKAEGVKESLLVWNDLVAKKHWIVDGYHRKRIADELHTDYKTRIVVFNDLDEAKEWMIIHQCARRNFGTIPHFYITELVRIRTARAKAKEEAKTKTQIVEESAQDLGISRRTAFNALSKAESFEQAVESFQEQKKDYEKRITRRKEQLVKEFAVECRQSGREPEESDEETLREKLEKEFEAETEELQVKSDELQELRADNQREKAETSQVAGAREKSDKPSRRKFSHKKEALKQKKNALRSFVTVAGKFQTAYQKVEGYFDDFPSVPFRALFERVEGLQSEMEKAEGKKRFGTRGQKDDEKKSS